MHFIKLSRASVPFSGRLKEYGYDEDEEKTRIEEEIKATMNEHYSAIIKDDLPSKEKDLRSLGKLAPTKLIIELADKTMKHPKGISENVLVEIDKFVFLIDFIVLDMLEDIKIPLILGRPFLSTAHAKIDVFKRKIALRIRDEKIVFKSDSPTSNIIKKVYILGLRERIELDLKARLMELRNHEIEELGPTIKEGEVIDEPMVDVVEIRNGDEILEKINEYPMIENMDAYCDKDMGDVVFGKPFCRVAIIEARRFDGFITIGDGNDSVTYQIARLHPRFKHLSNKQCNKIRPLLQVNARDKLEGNSHQYQKHKGFYKGVLNLGPGYIRDDKMFEWLTRGHVSMYEMD
ncbi:gag-pol polyprotein [Tanacetum coccineum]